MISGNDERIALVIETQARLEGVRAARAETASYAKAVQDASAQASRATQATTTAVDQSVRAVARSRDEFGRYRKAVADASAVQAEAAVAAEVTGAKIEAAATQSAAAETALAHATDKAAAAEKGAAAAADQAAAARGREAAGARAAAGAVEGIGTTSAAINPKVRTAANAMSSLAFAAQTATTGTQGMAMAAGTLAQSLAALSTSAKAASLATGIGAAVVVLTTMASLYDRMGERAREIAKNDYERSLSNAQTVRSQQAILESLSKQLDAQLESQGLAALWDYLGFVAKNNIGVGWGKINELLEKGFQLSEKIKDTQAREAREAKERARTLTEQYTVQRDQLTLETTIAGVRAKSEDSLMRTAWEKRVQLEAQRTDLVREINKRYEIRDADGEIIALTRTQIAEREKLVQQARALVDAKLAELDAETRRTQAEQDRAARNEILAGGNAAERLEARINEIEAERDAKIRAGTDAVLASQAAEAKIRAARRATTQQAMADYKVITDAMTNSNVRAIKAAGSVADTIRRVLIGADGARAAVNAVKEGAAAISSAAVGDFRGAAMHAASALEYGKAAALAAQESLGGSRAAPGGAGAGPTFEPRDRGDGGGGVTVILQTMDPYSSTAIGQTAYELGRAGTLKKPITVPPTRGLAFAGA